MKPGRIPFILFLAVFTLVFLTPTMTQNLRSISSRDESAYIETVPTPEIEVTESNENSSVHAADNTKATDATRHNEGNSITPIGPGETSLTYNETGKAPLVVKGIVISNSESQEKVLPEETKL